MKILLLAVSLLLSGLCVSAQHNHFVYVQSDNKQPFYVKLNDKLYSSSASGYAIISKLQKGEYAFSIGFPKNEFPQQNISITVNGDAGYMLKNFGDKGWGLYNMQTMDITMSGKGEGSGTKTTANTENFSNTLAGVVKTPSVKEATTDTKPVTTESAPVVAKEVPLVAPASIALISTSKDNSGRSVVYIDKATGSNDTIRVFIPYDIAAAPPPVTQAVEKEVALVTPKTPLKEGQKIATNVEEKKFLDIELVNPNETTPAIKQDEVVVPVTQVTEPVKVLPVASTTPPVANTPSIKPLTFNSDCRALATDDDFLKIRKKMAAEEKEDDMIVAAKKMFKAKCYSAEQVKNLSVLFLKDKDKYNFFDAAYPFIHDTQNFGALEAQLSDPYYITRFKAMIRN